MKRQDTEWDKIYVNHAYNKGHLSMKHEESTDTSSVEQATQLENGQEDEHFVHHKR